MRNSLIISSLLNRPVRTGATILSIAMEVVLIILVVGMTRGMIKDSAKRIEGIGADIVFQPPGSSYILASSTAAMLEKVTGVVKETEGVEAVTPVVVQFNTQGGIGLIYGIDLESFNQVTNGFTFIQGKPFSAPNEVIIDDIQAKSKKLKVGDQIQFLNHPFRVSGIFEHGKGSRIFLPLRTIQELTGTPGKISLAFIKCRNKDEIPTVTNRLRERFKGYSISPLSEFVSQVYAATNNVVALRYFLNIVVFVCTSVGFFAIFLAMYTAVAERKREIGILKSLGASKNYVLTVFLKEAFVLSGLGLAIGIGCSYWGKTLLARILPTFQVEIGADWLLKAGFIAFLSAGLGALYPALRASSQDPIDALAE
ncbi:MAG: FtsX-like permease family protein [Terriglobia bacterium]